MPVKGQTSKTRTAKSTKKGPKLKWWYILPVIAIVAISGYAIVRYSQASSTRWSFRGDNIQSYKVGTNKIRKANGSTWAAMPTKVLIPSSLVRTDRTVCADVYGPQGSQVTISVVQLPNIGNYQPRRASGIIGNAGNARICIFPGKKEITTRDYSVSLDATKDGWVSRIYQNN